MKIDQCFATYKEISPRPVFTLCWIKVTIILCEATVKTLKQSHKNCWSWSNYAHMAKQSCCVLRIYINNSYSFYCHASGPISVIASVLFSIDYRNTRQAAAWWSNSISWCFKHSWSLYFNILLGIVFCFHLSCGSSFLPHTRKECLWVVQWIYFHRLSVNFVDFVTELKYLCLLYLIELHQSLLPCSVKNLS